MVTSLIPIIALSMVSAASCLVAAPPQPRDASAPNAPRFNIFGDLLPVGPVVDGCKILPCAMDLLQTGVSCVPAVIQGGGNAVSDLVCLRTVLKDVDAIPHDCANCPEAIETEIGA